MNRLSAAVLVGLLCEVTARSVLGCPCSDDPGSGAFLTRVDERQALAVTLSTRRAHAVFDVGGGVHSFSADELEASEELLLRGARRLSPRLETQVDLGAASYRFDTPTFSEHQWGLGDLVVRGRYALLTEDMPHAGSLPAVAVALLLRAPLGAVTSNRSSSFGSGGAQLGLGAWELGAGADLSRSVGPSVRLSLSGELGYRLPDRTLARSRQLGPRLDFALAGDVAAAKWLGVTLAFGSRFVGDVALAGQRLPDTAERLISLSVALNLRPYASSLRSSLGLGVDPALAGVSQNTVATTTLSSTLAVGF